MATTFRKAPPVFGCPDDAYEGYITRVGPEAATQTFPIGSPVKGASGYVAVFVNPTDAKLLGFAKTAGNNDGTAGTHNVEFLLAASGLVVWMNLLGAAAADNVLAQADLWAAYDIAGGATLADGSSGWYLKKTTSDPVLVVTEFAGGPPNNDVPAVGDTNARLRCRVKNGVALVQ